MEFSFYNNLKKQDNGPVGAKLSMLTRYRQCFRMLMLAINVYTQKEPN
jgi:hypothetical protein